MPDVVTTQRDGGILVIIADNPPVNALGQAVRSGLLDGIEQAGADDTIEAVVIRCEGRTFFAGADITEFGKPPADPALPALLDRIEASTKPVIAAIHGTALGGGCELALACHCRIAAKGAKLGLPEVKLGLIPGAGGTQRLPRLIGAEAALEMIVTGTPVTAQSAKDLRLVDALCEDEELADEAIALARARIGEPLPRTSEGTANRDGKDPAGLFEQFAKRNARKLRGFDAPKAAIEAVRAACELPYSEGIERERALFIELMNGPQSRAMRHYFFAERAAGKIDGIGKDTPQLPVQKVGVIGAGTMGGGIAMNFLSAGIPVTIVETSAEALDRGVETIRSNYEGSARRGRISSEAMDAALSLLVPTLDYAGLADCDLVIEAVFEDMDIKKQVFAKLDAVAKPGAILATNTSYLDINEIAASTSRPGHVLGLHFFSPANVMKLLEVVRGRQTRDDVLATAMKLARTIGKIGVVSGVCHGFIGNRMLAARQEQANRLILEGANYWDVDESLTEFGFPMGPFQMVDLAGVDVGWHRDPSKVTTVREALCAAGRLGQKNGKGFYDYDDNRRRTRSGEVEEIIAGFAAKAGFEQRQFSEDDIRETLLFPMIDEGARILEEGIAQRASDIDVVWINGYGWPLYTGGPMFWAGSLGLGKVVSGLERRGLPVCQSLRAKAEAGEIFD